MKLPDALIGGADTDSSKALVALVGMGLATILVALGGFTGAEGAGVLNLAIGAFIVGHVGSIAATGWTIQAVTKAHLALEALKKGEGA